METKNAKKKMGKGKKAGIIAAIVFVVLIAAVLIYGFVITRSGYWLISRFSPDTEAKKMSYTSASDTTQVIADEGFVLMKNDGLLPLATAADNKTAINLFGMRGVQLVYNAGGSSASNVEKCIRLEDALNSESGNFTVNQDLLYMYYNYYKTGKISIAPTDAPLNKSASEFIEEPSNLTVPEVPANAYADTTLFPDGRSLLDHAHDFSDIAMVVVGRGGGEMVDFTPSQLQLSPDEADMVDAVCKKFDKVILVINSANPMELGFVNDYPSIQSVVWIGYPGESGIYSLVHILNGTVNPSGHLADTWLKDNLASPAAKNYLQLQKDGTWGIPGADKMGNDNFHYTNAPEGSGYFVQYSEGIYVGYKYFETRHDTDPSYKYDDEVMYPFGHGLSYTTFEQKIVGMEEKNGEVTLRVSVANTGKAPGKDAIEIYYNPPYTGAIEKATVNLLTYRKTNLIPAGETEIYSIAFPLEDMASYDYKTNKCYMLEKGDYEIMLRADAHTLLDSATYTLAGDIIYNEANAGKRSSDLQVAQNLFDDALGVDDYLTRDWKADSRAFTGPKQKDFTASAQVLAALQPYTTPTDKELGLTSTDMPQIGKTLDKTIMFSEMVGVPAGDAKWDEFVSQLTLEELANLSGNGAWQINGIERLGVPRTLTPDGSTTIGTSVYSGAIMGLEGSGVTYPIPVVTASTWNPEIAYIMGTSVGNEAQSIGFTGWYAPAMDTHRTAFNGRSFEYYSEDGVLAGVTAGNVIRGAREKGIVTFMKHFALNDRESNCRSYLFTWSNEQAMREIYLKPFEMAVKNGGSLGAMSSFNFIGSTWAGGNYNLLTELLRNEWGFEGLVITDANLYPFMSPVAMNYAGGNLSLDVMAAWKPGSGTHGSQMLEVAQAPDTEIGMTKNLVESAKDILFAVSNTWKASQS